MKKSIFAALVFFLTSCDAPYPDLSGLSPQAALSELSSLERELDRGEADLRRDFGPAATPVPQGELIAAGQQLASVFAQDSLNTIAEYRRRMTQDRERIYQANPSLRPAAPASSGNGVPSFEGPCALPKSATTDAQRRQWYTQASKVTNFGAFQTNAQVLREFQSNAGSSCSNLQQGIAGIQRSLDSAVEASNRLHNGPPLGLVCNPTGSASHASACTATSLMYELSTAAAVCHQVCR